jgi:hypothetical protein
MQSKHFEYAGQPAAAFRAEVFCAVLSEANGTEISLATVSSAIADDFAATAAAAPEKTDLFDLH